MRIVDHRIEGCWYRQSPNVSGALEAPTLIVMHYTAGGEGAADWLCNPAAKASAHVVIERDGSIKQIVPFNGRAWHAGPSVFRGRPHCNAYSIGIELANWGFCKRRADGGWYSWSGVRVPASRIMQARHKHGGPVYGWETFPEAQLAAAAELVRLLIEAYPSITAIAGHDDVAPRLKVDPGPAFPMERFQALVQPRNATLKTRTPLTSKTNAALVAGSTATAVVADHGDELVRTVQDVLPQAMSAAVTPGLVKYVLLGLALLPLVYALVRLVNKAKRGELVNL